MKKIKLIVSMMLCAALLLAQTLFMETAYAAGEPVVTSSGGSVTYSGTPVVVDNGISITDSDSTMLEGATVAIAGNFQSGDTLFFINTLGITGSYNAAIGVLTLTGMTTLANWESALRTITFSSISTSYADRTIDFQVNDDSLVSNVTAKTVTYAANDPPVNAVPGSQAVEQDASLVFSGGNGNRISISDADAGSGSVQIALTSSHGTMTLSGTTGLSFLVGSGSGDAAMTFTGSIDDINSALNGLLFFPAAGYNGAASLQITTDDQGYSGLGGAKTDTDTIDVTVYPHNPFVVSVTSSTANGTYIPGDTISIMVTFNKPVDVDTSGGMPTLLMNTGGLATYVLGSGSNTLTFYYTVSVGAMAADLDYASTSALWLNGASIQGPVAFDAFLTLPTPGGAASLAGNKAIVIDGIAANVLSVGLPTPGIYAAGNLDFTAQFDSQITVDTLGGTPRIPFVVGSETRYASYVSGSGTSTIVFRYTAAAGDNGAVSLGGAIQSNGGSLLKQSGMGINPALPATNMNITIDTLRPTVSTVEQSDDTLSITFNEPMNTGAGTVTISGGASLSSAQWSNGNRTLTYALSNLLDSSTYTLHIEGFSDVAGNVMLLDESHSFTTDAPADTLRPTVSSVQRANDTLTITFSEPMNTSVGTVTISGGASLSMEQWSNENRTLTYALSNLSDSTAYTLHIEGFSDVTGNVMLADDSRSFTTEANDLDDIPETGDRSYGNPTIAVGLSLLGLCGVIWFLGRRQKQA